MNDRSRAVSVLLILNIVAFAAGVLLPGGSERLVEAGALWYPTNGHFGVWQVVTYMFLHGGFGHIFFNMFALFTFGTILEREWGAGRFLLFYFLCGIGAGLVQWGVNWQEFRGLHAQLVAAGMTPSEIAAVLATGRGSPPGGPAVEQVLLELYRIHARPMLGASGAIYGIMVAFGLLHPNAKLLVMFIPVPVAAKILIPIMLGLDLFSGVTGFSLFGAGVAHFAHLGGAAIGFLLMLWWRKRPPRSAFSDQPSEFRSV